MDSQREVVVYGTSSAGTKLACVSGRNTYAKLQEREPMSPCIDRDVNVM